ncbi:hypothetical protein BT566P1_00041 [Bacteroides phage BT566P1]|nr:hypothetical protein BT566P1_00041 [Bacteroides phage BT566P1]WAX09437.1 hypothetical protein BT566P2_00008 [Bacteroides phage BT566P2]
MSCKYDIIDEDGRKRVRALRSFTVQGRDVCPMELGGYVYDDKTLSQEGNCWIFSGSLEYPGVRVMDEAIVDMGNNLPKNSARPKATILSGNSRIMGAISFETRSFDVAQTPAMFEQGTYSVVVGNVPVKSPSANRVRIPVPIFGGTMGKVAITSTAYEARLTSLNEAGIVVSASAWTVGGPAVTLTSTAPYILVDVRKVGETAISPADVTAAGITITQARGSSVHIFNSSIVSVYTGAVADASNILQYVVSGTSASPTKSVVQNSYLRVECVFNKQNAFLANADFIKANYNLALTGGVSHHLFGVFRNTNINTPASVLAVHVIKGVFNVSDCPNFEYSAVTFPDLAAMIASGKTFYFKNCNMPVGSAIHYYDPKVNTWDNLDFTKAMADLGKKAFADTTIISSNVQGMYRARGNASGSIGGLLEAASSFDNATYAGTAGATYDCITYKDCVVKGKFTLSGRCVFGGTQGGASRITNTKAEAMVVDGSFRIDGNAQVTDTPLKGTGYIGGNAELKNGVVEGYVYMDGNAKYIPAAVTNTPVIRHLIMRDNSQVLKQIDQVALTINMELYDNAVMDSRAYTLRGKLIMRENASTYRTDINSSPVVDGVLEMSGNSRIAGILSTFGDIKTVGKFLLASGNSSVYGKRTIADVSEIAVVELPPTKATW